MDSIVHNVVANGPIGCSEFMWSKKSELGVFVRRVLVLFTIEAEVISNKSIVR